MNLDEYIKESKHDRNVFFNLQSGECLNLLNESIDRCEELEAENMAYKQTLKNILFAHDTNIFQLTTGLLYEIETLLKKKEPKRRDNWSGYVEQPDKALKLGEITDPYGRKSIMEMKDLLAQIGERIK